MGQNPYSNYPESTLEKFFDNEFHALSISEREVAISQAQGDQKRAMHWRQNCTKIKHTLAQIYEAL